MKATGQAEFAQQCHQGLGVFSVAAAGFGNRQVQAALFASEAPFDRLVSVASKYALKMQTQGKRT